MRLIGFAHVAKFRPFEGLAGHLSENLQSYFLHTRADQVFKFVPRAPNLKLPNSSSPTFAEPLSRKASPSAVPQQQGGRSPFFHKQVYFQAPQSSSVASRFQPGRSVTPREPHFSSRSRKLYHQTPGAKFCRGQWSFRAYHTTRISVVSALYSSTFPGIRVPESETELFAFEMSWRLANAWGKQRKDAEAKLQYRSSLTPRNEVLTPEGSTWSSPLATRTRKLVSRKAGSKTKQKRAKKQLKKVSPIGRLLLGMGKPGVYKFNDSETSDATSSTADTDARTVPSHRNFRTRRRHRTASDNTNSTTEMDVLPMALTVPAGNSHNEVTSPDSNASQSAQEKLISEVLANRFRFSASTRNVIFDQLKVLLLRMCTSSGSSSESQHSDASHSSDLVAVRRAPVTKTSVTQALTKLLADFNIFPSATTRSVSHNNENRSANESSPILAQSPIEASDVSVDDLDKPTAYFEQFVTDDCLVLRRGDIHSNQWKALSKFLTKSTHVTSIRLQGVELTDSNITHLASTSMQRIERITLCDNSLGVNEWVFESLTTLLVNAPVLESVSFIRNSLQDVDVPHVISLITRHQHLKQLSLCWNGITNEGAQQLADCLSTLNSQLAHIDLGYNSITDDSCLKAISGRRQQLYGASTNLVQICISRNESAGRSTHRRRRKKKRKRKLHC